MAQAPKTHEECVDWVADALAAQFPHEEHWERDHNEPDCWMLYPWRERDDAFSDVFVEIYDNGLVIVDDRTKEEDVRTSLYLSDPEFLPKLFALFPG